MAARGGGRTQCCRRSAGPLAYKKVSTNWRRSFLLPWREGRKTRRCCLYNVHYRTFRHYQGQDRMSRLCTRGSPTATHSKCQELPPKQCAKQDIPPPTHWSSQEVPPLHNPNPWWSLPALHEASQDVPPLHHGHTGRPASNRFQSSRNCFPENAPGQEVCLTVVSNPRKSLPQTVSKRGSPPSMKQVRRALLPHLVPQGRKSLPI